MCGMIGKCGHRHTEHAWSATLSTPFVLGLRVLVRPDDEGVDGVDSRKGIGKMIGKNWIPSCTSKPTTSQPLVSWKLLATSCSCRAGEVIARRDTWRGAARPR